MTGLVAAIRPVIELLVQAAVKVLLDALRQPGHGDYDDPDPSRLARYRRHFRQMRKAAEGFCLALITICGCTTHTESILVGSDGYAYLAEPVRATLLVPKDGGLVRTRGTIPAGWVVMAPPPEDEAAGTMPRDSSTGWASSMGNSARTNGDGSFRGGRRGGPWPAYSAEKRLRIRFVGVSKRARVGNPSWAAPQGRIGRIGRMPGEGSGAVPEGVTVGVGPGGRPGGVAGFGSEAGE